MPNNNFYRGVRRTEIDLRQEVTNFLDGSYPEISKKQPAILRRMRKDTSGNMTACECVDEVTGEPDKDTFCISCFTGDAFVYTKDGYKTIDTVSIGENVLTKDGSFHPILGIQKQYSDRLLGIKTRLRCDEIKCTLDHRFFVISEKDRNLNRFIITEKIAEDLSLGDLLLMPKPSFKESEIEFIEPDWLKYKKSRGKDPIEKLPDRIYLSIDFLWTIGLWIAEGSVGGNRSLVFSLHIEEKDFACRVERCFKEISPDITVSHFEDESTNRRSVVVNNSILARWFSDICGRGCQNKRIPYFIFNNSPRLSFEVVKGIWDGDGHTVHIDNDRFSDRGSIGVTSREVVYQSQIILWLNGFFAGLSTYINKNKKKNKKRVYCLEWRLDPISKTRQFYEFDNYWATQITSIRHFDSTKTPVYDLTVDADHSYVVNNTVVHNCFGEGWIWDELFIDVYKVVIQGEVTNATSKRVVAPSLMNIPVVLFYTDYSETVTEDDKIVELQLNTAGNIVEPYKRTAIYRINTLFDFRADNGRLEYYKIATHKEDVKFLNGPSG